MKSSQLIPSAEVERMMKLQDVLLKALAKRISWLSAAEIIGVTPRTMRRPIRIVRIGVRARRLTWGRRLRGRLGRSLGLRLRLGLG